MKNFNEFDEIEQLKIKKILRLNYKKISIELTDTDLILFEDNQLLMISTDTKEYLFRKNKII